MPPSKRPAVRATKPTPLVIVPPPPKAELPGAVPLAEQPRARKHPLSPRVSPKARDARSKASREEIRREAPMRSAPRQGPAGRSGKPKSGTR